MLQIFRICTTKPCVPPKVRILFWPKNAWRLHPLQSKSEKRTWKTAPGFFGSWQRLKLSLVKLVNVRTLAPWSHWTETRNLDGYVTSDSTSIDSETWERIAWLHWDLLRYVLPSTRLTRIRRLAIEKGCKPFCTIVRLTRPLCSILHQPPAPHHIMLPYNFWKVKCDKCRYLSLSQDIKTNVKTSLNKYE